jgi:hypothetical protein
LKPGLPGRSRRADRPGQLARDEVDEGAHAGRRLAALRMNGVDVGVGRMVKGGLNIASIRAPVNPLQFACVGQIQPRRAQHMKTYRIATIPGDGIGKEVVPAGQKVLEALAASDPSFRFEFE